MPKQKVTITLDRTKAENARELVGAGSISEVVALALDYLISAERLRRDIAGYRQVPQSDAEVELALLGETALLDDETDWVAIYAEDRT